MLPRFPEPVLATEPHNMMDCPSHFTVGNKFLCPVCVCIPFLGFIFKIFKKSLSGLALPYLSELLHMYYTPRYPRSADQLLMEVPRTRRKLREDRAFSVARPELRKSLPPQVRQASSLSSFKALLKTIFFSLVFHSVWACFYGLCWFYLFIFYWFYCLLLFNVLLF